MLTHALRTITHAVVLTAIAASCGGPSRPPASSTDTAAWQRYCQSRANCGQCASEGNCVWCGDRCATVLPWTEASATPYSVATNQACGLPDDATSGVITTAGECTNP